MNAQYLTESEYEESSDKTSQGKTTTEENFAVETHYWKRFFHTEQLHDKELVHYMYSDKLNNLLVLVDINNHFRDDTLKSQKLIEKVDIMNGILDALGFDSIVDDKPVESETFMMNFLLNVLRNDRFSNHLRINELFGLNKRSRPSSDMTLIRMVNWINKLLQTCSARLKVTQGEVKIELLRNILKIIHRKNSRYIKGSRNLLGLNRNVEKKKWMMMLIHLLMIPQ